MSECDCGMTLEERRRLAALELAIQHVGVRPMNPQNVAQVAGTFEAYLASGADGQDIIVGPSPSQAIKAMTKGGQSLSGYDPTTDPAACVE